MADIWSGDILLPNQTAVKDISIDSHNSASVSLPVAPLQFLATVDTARIPLYLAAGPSLDVWTASEDTEEWFSSILLSKPVTVDAHEAGQTREWWTCARAQSPVSILAQVEGGQLNANGPRITEILFYGTIAAPAHGALPTPPSSSPDHSHAFPDLSPLPELIVHALPLSSDLLYSSNLPVNPPSSPALSVLEPPIYVEPQFLPPTHTSASTPASPKRKRDIFEEATQARKKARSKGGEGISAAAAKGQDSQRASGHRKSLSIDTKALPYPDSRPGSANALTRPSSRPLSRSPSISSDNRPFSRKGVPEAQAKRSALSQVATISLQPEEPTTESRNKEALSRVVMAAMRMHGLQQRKKNKSRRGSVAPGVQIEEQLGQEAAAEEAARDEEYKLIYHQTYKSAVLAFRKHISLKPLHSQPDRLRDVVERLLAIFCADPLAQPLPGDDAAGPLLATPGRQHLGGPGSTHSRASPFDMPSGARQNVKTSHVEANVHTGSPLSRRKPETVTLSG
ncbi:hypothetical protein SLS60_006488 [Paraconiothyrium brasiliense]|uniref:Sld7 C-terminal domain-containing protein n=1 Tax=Paraconiothyrium brasiliense TaxID=300254 RepID=A0ABR3RBH1_9PLEO